MDVHLLKKIYQLVDPYRRYFVLAVVLTFLVSVVSPAIPFMIQYTVDNKVMEFDGYGLWVFSGVIGGLLILQGLLQYGQTYLLNWLGQNAIFRLRRDVFNHIMSFRHSVFDRTPLGQFMTRCINDVEAVASVFSQGMINIIGDFMQVFIILGVMFYMDWELTLVCLTIFPFMATSAYIFKEKVKVAFQDVRYQVARLNSFLQEHITGMMVIQVFGKEDREFNNFQSINQDHRDAHIRSVLYYSVFFPVIEIFSAIAVALIVWYGAQNVLTGDTTIGVLMAFLLYLNLLFRPVRQIADRFNTLQMGMVASERIFRVMDHKEAIPDEGNYNPGHITGRVQFENVWFAYKEEEYILKDISFEADTGQTIAIVGATGAGKTTIINLLNRMYDIQHGSIKIDGVDIKDYDLSFLRSQIGVVLQDVFLFSDSVANNIKLYNSEINRKDIYDAAERLGAMQFINNLPGGLDYQVQERGATLSAGQRQVISFIRAVIQNPRILVLDEATSSVDNETEEILQQAAEVLLKGRTSVVIAHRLATIQNADKIIVMDHGKIREQGTHKELLARDGYYRRLCKMQFTELSI